jgi:hypothetical protein
MYENTEYHFALKLPGRWNRCAVRCERREVEGRIESVYNDKRHRNHKSDVRDGKLAVKAGENMQDLQFIKAYQENDVYRKSFNELASLFFGISFERCYIFHRLGEFATIGQYHVSQVKIEEGLSKKGKFANIQKSEMLIYQGF